MADVRRKVYTYRHTLLVAETLMAQAEQVNKRDNSIAAIIFCAFTLEGYLNHAGEELVPKWEELFESLKPKAKLILLAELYGININFASLPFQVFGTIFELRNQLAHPKTKRYNYEERTGKIWLKIGKTRWPAEKWETLCEAKYAEKFLEHTKKMIVSLDEALPLEMIPDFILSENV